MAEYRFTIDRSNLEGKQGIMKCDSDGYYNDVIVGVFNVENSIGVRYIIPQSVLDLLNVGLGKSCMAKWFNAGQLIGEREHPLIQDFISKDTTLAYAKSLWIRRHGQLDCGNSAMQFGGLRTVAMDKVDGRTPIAVLAKIRPTYDVLTNSLNDPNANTAFSLRSLIDTIVSHGEYVRRCFEIFTFDHVQLNGLPKCTKFDSPGCESAGVPITAQVCSDLSSFLEDESLMAGTESSAGIITQVIKVNGQWREVHDFTRSLLLGRQYNNHRTN